MIIVNLNNLNHKINNSNKNLNYKNDQKRKMV